MCVLYYDYSIRGQLSVLVKLYLECVCECYRLATRELTIVHLHCHLETIQGPKKENMCNKVFLLLFFCLVVVPGPFT